MSLILTEKSLTGKKEKRIVKREWAPNLKILCFPWVFSDFSLKYLLRGYFNFWNYFSFHAQFQFSSLSDLLLRGRADFFALNQSMGLARGHFTNPLDVQHLCLVVPWTSWTALAPSSYFFLETSIHPCSILSTLSLEKNLIQGQIWSSWWEVLGKLWGFCLLQPRGRKTGKVSFNPGQNFNMV